MQEHEKLRRFLHARVERQSDSTTPVFRVKEHSIVKDMNGCDYQVPLEPDMPGGTLTIRQSEPLELEERQWALEYEPQDGSDDFYERVVRPRVLDQGLPALVTGPPGTGKSHILLRCEEDLKKAGHTVVKISLTHVACRRLKDAVTAHSFIHRYILHGRFKGGWLLIDECGMLPAPVLTMLEGLAHMGVKFVLFGDWNQLPPPMNSWRASPVRADIFQHSRLLHMWAGGAEYRLTRCRRSNREHFDFCQGLLPLPIDQAVKLCRATFPIGRGPAHLQAETHLVISHYRRVLLNGLCQQEAVKQYRKRCPQGLVVNIETGGDKKGLNHQQDFELCEGTRLIGANNDTKPVCNGGFMTVGAVRAEDCDVLDEFGEAFVLTFAQLARCSRLAHAITITASQSREFEGRVCLWDLTHKHYSKNHLCVATSRVKHGSLLVVA
jgi:Cdc6-like AAA superfamily ATPase